MTEEIIINGVDVAGCEHLTEIQGCWLSTCDYLPYKGNITNQLCKYNDNCYYKQLKRLEFELKVTKADYEASEQERDGLKSLVDFEIQKLEVVEQELKELNEWFDKECLRTATLATENMEFKKENEKLKEDVLK